MAAYRELYLGGELAGRVEEALARLSACRMCPRGCGVDRLRGETAKCRTGRWAFVSSFGPHFGEEAPLVGRGGSGTIFFSHCNLRCVFCQNHDISQRGGGREVGPEELGGMMLSLEERGCHNINLVSPSHVVPQFLEALLLAAERGLSVPIVYNTGGYDTLETLGLLDGVVDIYMPDMKFSDAGTALRFSGVEHYPQMNRAAVKEMHRQVGDLVVDGWGVARRGLLVRHLVLPFDLAGTEGVVEFLAREVTQGTYFNIMDQYRPCYRALEYGGLARPPLPHELARAHSLAREQGLVETSGLGSPVVARALSG
ncbi:MAG: radical SAM protein [Dehalococcoidia bacterium]